MVVHDRIRLTGLLINKQIPGENVGDLFILASFILTQRIIACCAVESRVSLNSALFRKEGKDSIRKARIIVVSCSFLLFFYASGMLLVCSWYASDMLLARSWCASGMLLAPLFYLLKALFNASFLALRCWFVVLSSDERIGQTLHRAYFISCIVGVNITFTITKFFH